MASVERHDVGAPHTFLEACADEADRMRQETLELVRRDEDGGSVTFAIIAAANRARRARWHAHGGEKWSGADWGNAMGGEAGEAQNVIKKLRRLETGVEQLEDLYDIEVDGLWYHVVCRECGARSTRCDSKWRALRSFDERHAGRRSTVVMPVQLSGGRDDCTHAASRSDAALLTMLGDELADVILYIDLICEHYGIDLETHVREKFNRVSERRGFPERL